MNPGSCWSVLRWVRLPNSRFSELSFEVARHGLSLKAETESKHRLRNKAAMCGLIGRSTRFGGQTFPACQTGVKFISVFVVLVSSH